MQKEIERFENYMLPILNICSDGEEHKRSEIYEILMEGYTEEQKNIMLPSGVRGLLDDRISWAIFYLRAAEAIKSVKRGVYVIGENGRKLLLEKTNEINISMLKKYPEFDISKKDSKNTLVDNNVIEEDNDPNSKIINILKEHDEYLERQIIDTIVSKKPKYFENFVGTLLQKMGYGKFEETPISRDGGIDGIIFQDKLGVDRIYIQAKKYDRGNNVQSPDINKFAGVLHNSKTRSRKGIFITTSEFSSGAREAAASDSEVNIVLIDGHKLVELMIEYEFGVKVQKFSLAEQDDDFFDEDD